jgi:uncharacterized protein (DUF2267 family)
MEEAGLDYEHAERALRAFLVNLGTSLAAGEADDLAAQLPEPFAACVRHEIEPRPFPPEELIRRVVHTVPLTSDQARAAVQALFAILAEAVGAGRLDDLRVQLGAQYAELAGGR